MILTAATDAGPSFVSITLIEIINLEPGMCPQSIQQHLHHHALPVMRRRDVGKNQNLTRLHSTHTSAH